MAAGQHPDFLLHFGSQDAIWNGAWGLLRVNNGQRDEGLAPLYGGDGLAFVTCGNLADPLNGTEADCLGNNDASGMMLRSPLGTPQVQIWAIAATVAQLGWQDREYRSAAPALSDPDGLVLLPSPEVIDRQRSNLGAIIDGYSAAPLRAPAVWRVMPGRPSLFNVVNAIGPNRRDARGDALLPGSPRSMWMIPTIPITTSARPYRVLYHSRPAAIPCGADRQFRGHERRHNPVPYPKRSIIATALISRPNTMPDDWNMSELERAGKVSCNITSRRSFRMRLSCRCDALCLWRIAGEATGRCLRAPVAWPVRGLIIEPEGSRTYDPRTGALLDRRADGNVIIRLPGTLSSCLRKDRAPQAIVCTASSATESGPSPRVADCAGGAGFPRIRDILPGRAQSPSSR